MSIRIMNAIWQDAPYRGNTLLTLLALADWANDEGVCWPQMDSLAKKSRQSVRSTQYAIEQLIADGIVEAEINPGKGKRNLFQVKVQNLHHSKRCNLEQQMVQNTTPNGAKRDSAIRKNHHEPSVNHQNPPNPPLQGGLQLLTPRQLKNLSSEMNQMAHASLGAQITERELLQRACQKLLIPFDAAYQALTLTLPPEERF